MATIGRAVVVGGSMAGLGAAAYLARHCDEVVLVERREWTDGRSVAPQAGLPHVLLAAGGRVLSELLPGGSAALAAAGADRGGPDPARIPGHWAAAGAVRDHIALPGSTLTPAMCSRDLLEHGVRTGVSQLPAVSMRHDTVERLLVSREGRAVGVVLRDGREVEADLVVDASGRTLPLVGTPGVPTPPTSEVHVDVRYTSFLVERRPEDFAGGSFGIVQNTAGVPRGGVAVPHESGAWQVGLTGYFGDGAPSDSAGARAFAASLPDPVLAPLLERPFLAAPRHYRFRCSKRRHWERLRRYVEGYVPIGDAVASFNPIYAQGMSSALVQARVLDQTLREHGTADISRRMARGCARVVGAPWLMATGGDFVYPQTRGHRPLGQPLVNAYVDRVLRAAAVDEEVNAAFSAVQQLLAPPAALFAPSVVARVARAGGRAPRRVAVRV